MTFGRDFLLEKYSTKALLLLTVADLFNLTIACDVANDTILLNMFMPYRPTSADVQP